MMSADKIKVEQHDNSRYIIFNHNDQRHHRSNKTIERR